LSIHLLGSFQVNLDGEPVTGFESDKVRALLAYLAVETGGPHRREKLAGLCWPELPERSARNNLRVALANLRKLLGDHARVEAQGATPPFLFVSRQSIQINPETDVWLDVAELTQRLETTGRPRRVVRRLAEAVELYRGGFLEGLSLPDSVALEEWALLEREHLQRQVVTGLRWLAGWYERQALTYARRQVLLEPWQEQGQRQVMRLLVLTGQRNAALAQYQGLRRMLADDLGVEPDDKTEVLYQRIRAGEDVRVAVRELPHNLPTSLLPFVGREKELDEIYASLRAPGCRLLSLVGPGGSGKTRLALEAATDLLSSAALSGIEGDSYVQPADGIFFVPLARLGSTASITPTVADALGFTFRDGRDPRQQLLEHLRQKQMLLILDNFEHLLKGANWVVDLLRAAPDVRILITSRSRLNLQAEHPLAVAGLAIPGEHLLTPRALDRLRRYDSVELFCAGGTRAQPDFRLTIDNAVDVVRICRLLDGMPLGILLAASWMDSMTPAQIASEIGQSLDFLGSDWLDLPARQRSLRAVFDHSWTLLGEHEQEILRTLSVFRGGFTYGAVKAVAGASLRGLRRLVNQCLLYYHTPSGRYEIHELLRQYAAEKLEASGRADAASDAHSAYYTAALKQWGVDLKGPKQQEALADLGVEIEDARTAWNWAARNGKVARLAGALDGLCHFYEWRVRQEEGETACRLATEGLAATDESVTGLSVDGQRLLARVLVWQGTFTYLLGRVEPARQLMCRGLALLKELDRKGHDTRAERAHALLQMGSATVDSDREEAKGYCERSLELYRAVGDRWGTANVLGLLGSVRRRLNLYGTETKRLLEESLALHKTQGDRRGIARSRGALANLLAFRWELEESARLYRESIASCRETGDKRLGADQQGDLIFVLLALGEFAEARSRLKENLAVCENLGSKRELAYALAVSSFAELHHGRYERARTQADESRALATQIGYRWAWGSALWYRGCAALAAEAHDEAEQSLEEGIAVLSELLQWDEVAAAGATRAVVAVVAIRRGRLSLAKQCLCESVRSVVEVGGFYSPMPTLSAMALYEAHRGGEERAVELYALAQCSPLVASSRWYEDVFGQPIAAIGATLPSAVTAAAQERGRSLDLAVVMAEQLVRFSPEGSSPNCQMTC